MDLTNEELDEMVTHKQLSVGYIAKVVCQAGAACIACHTSWDAKYALALLAPRFTMRRIPAGQGAWAVLRGGPPVPLWQDTGWWPSSSASSYRDEHRPQCLSAEQRFHEKCMQTYDMSGDEVEWLASQGMQPWDEEVDEALDTMHSGSQWPFHQ